MNQNREERPTDLIYGRNAVLEALKSDQCLDKLYIAAGDGKGSIGRIIGMARDRGIPVKDVTQQKLDAMCGTEGHQGVAATVAAVRYSTLEEVYQRAEEKGEPLFVILADEIEDPHNLGALIRTAECSGAHGIIIPKRRSAGLSPTVFKASAGAASYLPVVRVANLAAAMEELKGRGVWLYCADMDGQTWCKVDYSGAVGLVVGSEGNGVGRLIKEKCDFTVALPMLGSINSLNASVAGGILMYEIARQRLKL
ncbi:23S rRNA (guanosine(2251)-2'-O)-methyltransferase RlmB [Clostridiaceae bacterium NSJ-31]|uniref:23S rRNA (Guanosine(2251)-2'-O)-methyltransferase RlmB n=1 Tax=Ligaoa zhengdingensis TaxID=2763658 RepID=A0A926I3Q6_9FIRM|nr:23S rRNA (guanosine(2251)-2'-O)-methyltransferase RlmB [Ligaoa zhengdingensis]MBC8545763.1 23S rRNA (guanosine(2251)-2'-O)-methyltransferase RlmB [Ligaoa zhengdingensis]